MNRAQGLFYGVLAAGVAACSLAQAVGADDDAVSQRPCLNYYTVGDSKSCAQPKPTRKPPQQAAKTSSPTITAAGSGQASSTLDRKIDEFLANHGKPPREFVAFYLEPTPEHAIEWVAKYNELLNRGQDIAVAWTQAEKLYNDALRAGATSSTLNPTALPPVPDFGIPVPGFNTPAYTQLMSSNTTPVMPAVLDVPPPAPAQIAASDAAAATGLLKPLSTPDAKAPGKAIAVSYYFSGVCPYCKKFEPDFAQVLSEIGSSVILTCVDVTPEIAGHTRTPENIGDRLPCSWRAATEEELSRLKISQTPSLIINRGDNKPLELVSGYVEPEKLKNYLIDAGKRP